MYQLIYTSRAAILQSKTQLESILQEAREFNASQDITGLLLYKDGSFIQFLEGDEERVSNLYKSIRKDRRHFNVTTLTAHDSGQRDFEEWSMAFFDLSTDSEPEQGLKAFDLESVLNGVSKNSQIRKLVKHFMEQA